MRASVNTMPIVYLKEKYLDNDKEGREKNVLLYYLVESFKSVLHVPVVTEK